VRPTIDPLENDAKQVAAFLPVILERVKLCEPKEAIPDTARAQYERHLALFEPKDWVWHGDTHDTHQIKPRAQWQELSGIYGHFISHCTFQPEATARKNDFVESVKYLVVESDEIPKEQQHAVFGWLRDYAGWDLRMVLDTAGKSLHAWFTWPGHLSRAEIKALLDALKCDTKLLTASQPCRVAGAMRDGKMQSITWLGTGRNCTPLPWADLIEGIAEAEAEAETPGGDDWSAPEPEPVASIWHDIGPILEGDFIQELPTVGPVAGGKFLFYAGRLNEIHAEPGVGKSNVNISVCALELNRGATVVYIDPEDTPAAVVGRLMAFGARKEAIKRGFLYLHNPEPGDVLAAVKWVTDTGGVKMVVIDGLAELIAATGESENDAGEILRFFQRSVRPFAEAGAAVVLSDHVTKDKESRGRWARGSGAKMGRYDGVSYQIETMESYGPTKAGGVRLIVAKDRNGGVGPVGCKVAEIRFTPAGAGTQVEIKQASEFRPTVIMSRIMFVLEQDPEISMRGLRERVGGKSAVVDQAVNALEEMGCIEIKKGLKNKIEFEVKKPFEEGEKI
jgi:hypothetical protein